MKTPLLVLLSILLLGGAVFQAEASLDSRLIDAAEAGEAAEVRKLLSTGASVNAHSPIGKTALMFAAQEGRLEVVEILLDNGAYLEAETSDGCKALFCAAGAGQLEVVKLLLKRGANISGQTRDPEEVDKDGNTPLILAAGNGTVELSALLIKAGAAVDQRAPYGETALMQAAYSGHVAFIKSLTRAGAGWCDCFTLGCGTRHDRISSCTPPTGC
jgi:ankyrin repeat protein